MEKQLKPLGIQLYSLRNLAAADLPAVLKQVAAIGFEYVEPAGFWDLRPSEFRKIAADLGLRFVSSHSPWANPKNLGECMEVADILGLDKIVCGYGPEAFADQEAIKRTAETTRRMAEKLRANGFTLFQHNHYWEFERLDGRLKYELYRELCPGVKFQIDCFWSTNRGTEDPVAMLKLFGRDTISLHMKDGVCRQQSAVGGMDNGLLDVKVDLLPLGSGTLPIRELMAAAPDTVEAVIVELDYCSMEIVAAIEQSYRFMTENGLARGRR